MKINIYIDGNNLYRAAKTLGFDIDYGIFGVWLRQKYNASVIFLFIGFLPKRIKFYEYLRENGYILIFKEIIFYEETIKGNCDAELVLKLVSDFYTKSFNSCVLITGDGDFGCLVEFLKNNAADIHLIAPNKKRCSVLLKNKYVKMTFLNNHYHKFSKMIKSEKAPDADASA